MTGTKELTPEELAMYRECARTHEAIHPGPLLAHLDVLTERLQRTEAERDALTPRPVREMYACGACGAPRPEALPCEDHPMQPVRSLHPSQETLVAWLDHEQQEAKALHSALKAANERWQKAEADIAALLEAFDKGDRFAGDLLWAMKSEPMAHPGAALLERHAREVDAAWNAAIEAAAKAGADEHARGMELAAEEDADGRKEAAGGWRAWARGAAKVRSDVLALKRPKPKTGGERGA